MLSNLFLSVVLRAWHARAAVPGETMSLLQQRADLIEPASDLPTIEADPTDFALGISGTSACPLGFRNIQDESKCKIAKDALDLPGPWRGKDIWPFKPVGCFTDPSGDLYVNTNTSGAGVEGYVPICHKDVVEKMEVPISMRDGGLDDATTSRADNLNVNVRVDNETSAEAGSQPSAVDGTAQMVESDAVIDEGGESVSGLKDMMSDLDSMEAQIMQARTSAEAAKVAVGSSSSGADQSATNGGAIATSAVSALGSLDSVTQDRAKQIAADALAKIVGHTVG